jgi:hypothetical protein
MIVRQRLGPAFRLPLYFVALSLFVSQVHASYGDRLPEFRECVEVNNVPPPCDVCSRIKVCQEENCASSKSTVIRMFSPMYYLSSQLFQLSCTVSSSGLAHKNAITPASTSSPINVSQHPNLLFNSTGNGRSIAS